MDSYKIVEEECDSLFNKLMLNDELMCEMCQNRQKMYNYIIDWGGVKLHAMRRSIESHRDLWNGQFLRSVFVEHLKDVIDKQLDLISPSLVK